MEKLYETKFYNGVYELPYGFKKFLDEIILGGKIFKIEDYYGNTVVVIVKGYEIYMYRTEVLEGEIDGYNVECTLSKLKNKEELYNEMIKRIQEFNKTEIIEKFNEINEYLRSQ